MSQIGHNHVPLEERIFSDPSVSVDDVLAAVASRIQRQNADEMARLSSIAEQLSGNIERLPETFTEAEAKKALDLLARLDAHSDDAEELRTNVCQAAQTFVENLSVLCKPLDQGLAALEKALRPKIEQFLVSDLDSHNADLADGEAPMTSLTLRSASGAKATMTDSVEMEIADKSKIPTNFLIPDAKALGAAFKAGEKIPGLGEKRKTSLRISCK